MKLTILILATLIASITISEGENIRVGPVMLGIDLSAFNNAKVTYPDNTSSPLTITDYDGYWFEEHRTIVEGDENKYLILIYRKFANGVSPDNFLALYDIGELDRNHYNSPVISANWIIYRPDGTPAGVLVYSEPYPQYNDSHTFLSYWLSNREEFIFALRNLTCQELNSTINSISIKGYVKNEKFININMHCT